jgi:hypothetical protein
MQSAIGFESITEISELRELRRTSWTVSIVTGLSISGSRYRSRICKAKAETGWIYGFSLVFATIFQRTRQRPFFD